VNCPSCGQESPDDASFCGECGASLARVIECPSCGRENPPEQRFCHGCGHSITAGAAPAVDRAPRDYTPKHLADKILHNKSALEGERKQVTVLFADVKGAMELAEKIDPEVWHRILDRFFQILSDGVHRFEGTVNQYTGDGIMALFGAPIAHEDHAQRACYAALHLQDELRGYANELRLELGFSFAVRIGLNSGQVVVGKIGDDLRMDYTAQGRTVGLGARMEQLAEPGTTYLTEYTAALVSGYFELEDLGPSKIRGSDDSLRIFALRGMGAFRSRLDVSRARGFSRFVGRVDEMAALEAALERSLDGDGRVVGVVGEAGVGKSRLCYEFAARCRVRGLRVSEGRGVAHGKMIPFLPMLDYLRGFFAIGERDPAQLARNKIAGTLLLLDRKLEDALPLLFEFLGVPDPDQPALRIEPEARQRQLQGVVKHMIEARSRREPGVMLLEDLHWLDAGSDEFLVHLVESVPGTRTLLLVNFRPEYHADWMQRSTYQQVALLPLGTEAIGELLRDLLGADPSLADLPDRIRERTGGNPFFMEEVVLSLAEEGTLEGEHGAYRLAKPLREVAVPASVQGVLSARIDRLPEREKQVLQTAAVAGRSFTEPLLRRVTALPEAQLGEALRALLAAEFVYEQALYPEAEYAFKHALTQEVAYGSQLGEPRARIHEGVARVIEERFPDKLDEQAALIASHWDRAGKAREAAEWHRRAGVWVGFSNAPESLRHWSRVRELLAQVPESPETITLTLDALSQILFGSIRVGVSESEISDLLEEGRGLASHCTDRQAVTFFLASASAVVWNLGRLDEYCRLAEEARSVSDQVAAGVAPIYSRSAQATAYVTTGRLDEALVVVDEVIELAHESSAGAVGGVLPTALFATLGLAWRTWILTLMGRLPEAARALEEGFERAAEGGDLGGIYWCHYAGTMLATARGDSQAALVHGRQGVEAAEQSGSRTARTGSYVALGKACVAAGQWDEALAALPEALSGPREYGTARWLEPEILSQMAAAHLGLHDGVRARELADQGAALAREQLAKPGECEAELVRARVLLGLDGFEAGNEIASALDTASALAEEMNTRRFEPFICEERARLARVSGDVAAFGEGLRESHRLYTEMGATGHAERLARELGLAD
jgi:class 3 adenylate cyclase/tetratricopeptide (TPR) repeat protein